MGANLIVAFMVHPTWVEKEDVAAINKERIIRKEKPRDILDTVDMIRYQLNGSKNSETRWSVYWDIPGWHSAGKSE